MRLTKKAIKAADQKKTRLLLALTLNCTEQWIIKSLDQNKENGLLTTAASLQVIREKTGLRDDQILENVTVPIGK